MKNPEIRAYEDKAGGWRWRLVDTNGRIIADGAESYVTKSNATRAAHNAQDAMTNATVFEYSDGNESD